MRQIVLLGPQRFQPGVKAALDGIGASGVIAAVTAGWQEREEEDGELREHCGCEVINLQVYQRVDEILSSDRELAAAVRARQELLHRLQQLYRMRLSHMLVAARELMQRRNEGPLLLAARRAAIRAVRTLDRQHLQQARRIHAEFDEHWLPALRPRVARQRDEVEQILGRCTALAIAGGHVAVLLNRLRLLDLLPMAGDLPIVAWSAGAMALAERVVLFHDHPPQGAGDAEVLDAGLGEFRNLVPLPHAGTRLELDNPTRVALFARRFSPARCVLLDSGARIDWVDAGWHPAPQLRSLGRRGNLPVWAG